MSVAEEEDQDLYYQDSQLLEEYPIVDSQEYTVFQFEDIFKQLEEEITSIQEIVSFNFDNTLELLIHYNWNIKNIHNDYFSGDQDKIIQELKSTGEFNDHKNPIITKGLCLVCLENEELVQFVCGHGFCRICLKEYVKSIVEQEEYHYVRCLQNQCLYRFPYSFIVTCTNSYNRVLCKQYILKSKSLACCTGPDCNRIIKPLDPFQQNIQCECGTVFCFRCKQDTHYPVPCDLAQQWLKTGIRLDENQRWLIKNTKMCPFCKQHIERSIGCNYMLCRLPVGCGKAFCYACGNPWNPHHNNFFICNMQENKLEPQREILMDYDFYRQRYLHQEVSKKKVKELFAQLSNYNSMIGDAYGVTNQDSQFLSEALNELNLSRVLLKWSYCLGYYINFNNQTTLLLFDNYLGLFSASCEQLQINLAQILQKIEIRCVPFNRKHMEIHTLKKEFLTMKEEVQAACVKCAQFRRNWELQVQSSNFYI